VCSHGKEGASNIAAFDRRRGRFTAWSSSNCFTRTLLESSHSYLLQLPELIGLVSRRYVAIIRKAQSG
jgi:hypothetical protein